MNFARLQFFGLLSLLIFLASCGSKLKDAEEIPEDEVINFEILAPGLERLNYYIEPSSPYRCDPSQIGVHNPANDKLKRDDGTASVSPRIVWQKVPSKTKSIAIIMKQVTNFGTSQSTLLGCRRKKDHNGNPGRCINWEIFNIDPFVNEGQEYATGKRPDNGGWIKDIDYLKNPDPYASLESGIFGANWKGEEGYVGICPKSRNSSIEYRYEIEAYALDTMIATDTKNNSKDVEPVDKSLIYINKEDFEERYKDNILANDSIFFRSPGLSFSLSSSRIDKNNQEILSTIDKTKYLGELGKDAIEIRKGRTLVCGDDSFVNPGIMPDLNWANSPNGTEYYMLYMTDLSSMAQANRETNPNFIFADGKKAVLADSDFQIKYTDAITCNYNQCNHLALLFPAKTTSGTAIKNIVENFTYISGKASPDFADFLKNFSSFTDGKGYVGRNLFSNVAYAATENVATQASPASKQTIAGVTKTTETRGDHLLTSIVQRSYFGPCAPIGSGKRNYAFTLIALNENFKTIIEGTTDEIIKGEDISLREYVTSLSVENFLYYFGSEPLANGSTKISDRGINIDSPTNNFRRPSTNFVGKKIPEDGHSISEANYTKYYGFYRRDLNEQFHLPSEDPVIAQYVLGIANLRFSYQDTGCELCRFCLIGNMPSDPGLSVWEHYGYGSPTGVATYQAATPTKPQDVGL